MVARQDLGGNPNAMLHGLVAVVAAIVFGGYAVVTTLVVALVIRTLKGALFVHAAAVVSGLILAFGLGAAEVVRINSTKRELARSESPTPAATPAPVPAKKEESAISRLSSRVSADLASDRWTRVTPGCTACSLDAVVASLVPAGAEDCAAANPACVLDKAAGAAPFKGEIPLRGSDSRVSHTFVRTGDRLLVMVAYDSSVTGAFGRCAQSISVYACDRLQPGDDGNPECVRRQLAGTCRDMKR